jgi:hypothetical protein
MQYFFSCLLRLLRTVLDEKKKERTRRGCLAAATKAARSRSTLALTGVLFFFFFVSFPFFFVHGMNIHGKKRAVVIFVTSSNKKVGIVL